MTEVFSDGDLLRGAFIADEIIRGLTIQNSEQVDNNFVDDVTENLFDDGEMSFDLVALNIQRGRDHGIPGYVQFRKLCGSDQAKTFHDLESNIAKEVTMLKQCQLKLRVGYSILIEQKIELLQKAYKTVEDIDLFIGMILENPVKDGLAGPTFLCLIGEVFTSLRIADRFFYDLKDQVGSFEKGNYDGTTLTICQIIRHNFRSTE